MNDNLILTYMEKGGVRLSNAGNRWMVVNGGVISVIERLAYARRPRFLYEGTDLKSALRALDDDDAMMNDDEMMME